MIPVTSASDADRDNDGAGGNTGVGVATKAKPKTAKPALYKVLMLNRSEERRVGKEC